MSFFLFTQLALGTLDEADDILLMPPDDQRGDGERPGDGIPMRHSRQGFAEGNEDGEEGHQAAAAQGNILRQGDDADGEEVGQHGFGVVGQENGTADTADAFAALETEPRGRIAICSEPVSAEAYMEAASVISTHLRRLASEYSTIP